LNVKHPKSVKQSRRQAAQTEVWDDVRDDWLLSGLLLALVETNVLRRVPSQAEVGSSPSWPHYVAVAPKVRRFFESRLQAAAETPLDATLMVDFGRAVGLCIVNRIRSVAPASLDLALAAMRRAPAAFDEGFPDYLIYPTSRLRMLLRALVLRRGLPLNVAE
jgi:hypothetical protein